MKGGVGNCHLKGQPLMRGRLVRLESLKAQLGGITLDGFKQMAAEKSAAKKHCDLDQSLSSGGGAHSEDGVEFFPAGTAFHSCELNVLKCSSLPKHTAQQLSCTALVCLKC